MYAHESSFDGNCYIVAQRAKICYLIISVVLIGSVQNPPKIPEQPIPFLEIRDPVVAEAEQIN